jgi:glycogen(starch) synthase
MYGGLGRHVHALAHAQAANGHDVVVITQAPRGAAEGAAARAALVAEQDGPVRVLRVGSDPAEHDPHDLLGHVAQMEWAFAACGEELLAAWSPDVVHAHDWMVSHAAVTLRRATGAPLVATIHATEAGRNRGWVSSELSTTIHGLEWWLANTADAVITCSAAMDAEIRTLFGVGATRVISNGIDLAHWIPPDGAAERMRARYADADPLIAYTGRVEWEKGVQTVIAAMPSVRASLPRARLLVAGRGSYLPALESLAHDLGLDDTVQFLGWVSEEDLRAIVATSDIAVAPSLYEPFGLVALEAAALGTPVVAAETGGLAEFAAGGTRALTFRPGDPVGLAAAIERSLSDPAASRTRAACAAEALVVHYDWRVIAEETVEAYATARQARGAGDDDPHRARAAARDALAPPHLVAPLGRLLDTGP